MHSKTNIILTLLFASIAAAASDYTYVAGEGLMMHWQNNDKASITTGKANILGEVVQRAFYVTELDGTNPAEATINAPSFMLSPNSTYYTYYPYKWYDDFDPTAVACIYGSQRQVGNNNPSGLAANDLCIAKIETTDASDYTIDYKHVGSVMRITMNAPSTAQYASLTLKTLGNIIPAKGNANLLIQQMSYSDYGNSIDLVLDGVTINEGEPLTAYLMLPVADLSKEQILITLTDIEGQKYEMTAFTGPDIKAGMLYDVVFTDVEQNAKKRTVGTSVLSVEFPVGHLADIPIDKTFDGNVQNVITTIVNHSETAKTNSYAISGTATSKSGHGIVITKDINGKIKKHIVK